MTEETMQDPTPYSDGIADLEAPMGTSRGNPFYPVAQGGPLGQHGFLASTWRGYMAAHPEKFANMTTDQAMALRSDKAISSDATDWLAGVNSNVLRAHGIAPTPQNLGVAHAFGGAGASGILKYGDDTPLPDVLRATQPGMVDDILSKNPQYKSMTVGDIKNKYAFLNHGYTSPVDSAAAAATEVQPAKTASTVPSVGATGIATAPSGTNNPLNNLVKLSLLNNLIQPTQPAQQQTPLYVADARNPTAWANNLVQSIPEQTLQNPMQSMTQLMMLRSLMGNGDQNPQMAGLPSFPDTVTRPNTGGIPIYPAGPDGKPVLPLGPDGKPLPSPLNPYNLA